jgi:hypothetical protein
MRKYRSFGETNLKYGIFSKTNFKRNEKKEKKKSDGKFPIKKIQSADFDRVGRVRGNKLIFNFGLMAIELNAYIIVCLKKLTMRLNSAYKFEPLL